MATAATSQDLERHVSAIIVVVDIYPQMMREMIINSWPPGMIAPMVKNVTSNESHPFTRSLNGFEKKIIGKLSTEGYSRCDVTLLYKLIRHFGLVETPTGQWGYTPSHGDLNQGDDVERMRRKRNEILHRPRGGLLEHEKHTFFQESEGIAQRIDVLIGRPANGFENRIQSLKIYSVTREKYIQILEKYNDLQERFQNISGELHVDLYYDNDITVKFERENGEDPSGVTLCSIYLHDPNIDVSKVIEILDEVKQKLNEGNVHIKIRGAENKCLLVHVKIDNKCFTAKELLHKAIESFLQKLFRLTSLNKILRSPAAVVLAESDNIYEIDTTEDSYEDLNQTDHGLKLDVSVQNNVFESEEQLYHHVKEVCNEIVHLTNPKLPTNGSSLGVVMTVQKNNGILDNRRSNISGATGSSRDSDISLKMSEFLDKIPRSRLPHLKEELYNWVEDKDNVVKELNDLADNLDEHFNRICKAQVGGSATTIVGGILAFVGFVLSFHTFGASLGLAIAGGVIAGSGGATVTGAVTTDAVLSQISRKSAEDILKKYNSRVEGLKIECIEIGELLKQHGNIEESFQIWKSFWAKLVIGKAALDIHIGWDIISRTVINSLQAASHANDTILAVARAGLKAVDSTPGSGLYSEGVVFGILLLSIDIYTLVDSSINVPKTNPHKVSEGIRKTAAQLTEECPSKEDIDVMIERTLSYFDP